MKYSLLLIISIALLTSGLSGQTEWEVPADRQARLSPFAFTDESRNAGEEIYILNCKSCHGDPGKANFRMDLNPIPGDPAGRSMQSNSDGALYYKITEGFTPMPSFRMVLTADEIWNVISYIRTFNQGYVQKVAEIQQLKDVKWSLIKILFKLNAEENVISASVTGLEGKKWTPVPNTEVMLMAKRYFGNLVIDEPKLTNMDGVVTFSFPADLPAEREGGLTFTAMLTNQDLFGTIRKDTTLMVGSPNTKPSLREERAMWNTVHRAPIWILATYIGGVFLVWGFIIYVLFQLKAVYDEGDEGETSINQ